jgi:hypothetical protein
MNRSVRLSALLLAASPAVLSTGCQVSPEPLRCVDYQNRVVVFSACSLPAHMVKLPGNLNPVPTHRYYYGGYGGPEFGSRAWGGSDKPLRAHAYRPAGQDAPLVERTVANSPQPYVEIPKD